MGLKLRTDWWWVIWLPGAPWTSWVDQAISFSTSFIFFLCKLLNRSTHLIVTWKLFLVLPSNWKLFEITNVFCPCLGIREMTEREYIIPLTSQMQTLSLYRQLTPHRDDYTIKHTIPNMDSSVSIRPKLTLTKKDIETRYGYSVSFLLAWERAIVRRNV